MKQIRKYQLETQTILNSNKCNLFHWEISCTNLISYPSFALCLLPSFSKIYLISVAQVLTIIIYFFSFVRPGGDCFVDVSYESSSEMKISVHQIWAI